MARRIGIAGLIPNRLAVMHSCNTTGPPFINLLDFSTSCHSVKLWEDVMAPIVSSEKISEFRAEGVTVLRGVFSDWVDVLRKGVDANMADPDPNARIYTPSLPV